RLLAPRLGGGQPLAHLPRAGTAPRRLLRRAGLHPRRAAAGDGAPVLRLVGLPDDRLLRTDAPLRHARRPDVDGRPPPPAGRRRAARLGTLALPQRRAR